MIKVENIDIKEELVESISFDPWKQLKNEPLDELPVIKLEQCYNDIVDESGPLKYEIEDEEEDVPLSSDDVSEINFCVRNEDSSEDLKSTVFLSCCECNFKTKWKDHLRDHSLGHQRLEDTKFQCYSCETTFVQKASLKRHIYEFHRDLVKATEELYRCNQCSYSTGTKRMMTSHMDKHKDDERMLNCDKCDFQTKYRRNLLKHRETHQPQDLVKIYECKQCYFKTRLRSSLKRHLLTRKHLRAIGKINEYSSRSK